MQLDDVIVCLDVEGDLAHVVDAATSALPHPVSPELHRALTLRAETGMEVRNGVGIVHIVHPSTLSALVRLAEPLDIEDESILFVWILACPDAHPALSTAVEFAQLMHHRDLRVLAMEAATTSELLDAFRDAFERATHFEQVPPELRRSGKLFGGMIADLRRRLPYYGDDWRAGVHPKVLGASLFMFFACLAPAVAFGGLLATLTDGHIGAVETVLASAVCGVLWSLFAGQPLTIVGATGPNVIFTGILYGLCVRYDVPFLPAMAWTGLWAGAFMLILAALDASALIRFFTRFSDEVFAALIALIFITEAVRDILVTFDARPRATALLSLILAFGTFELARSMSRFRRSPYLRARMREFLGDFGPALALIAMTIVGWWAPIELDTLEVPERFAPTMDRSWLVDPMDAPTWVIGATALPAALLTMLIWTNQNITARLANSPDHRLHKGPAFHWDIAVMGVLVAGMSMFGLPWVVAAVVRSLNHVKSLAVEVNGRLVGVIETRLSNLIVHVMLGIALFLFLPWLDIVPMPVLFGMFLFMGVGTLGGNQFAERLRLWVVDPKRYPSIHFFRAVPPRRVHAFTGVQLVCLSVLWIVKVSAIGILFPLFLMMLVPVRMILGRFFPPDDLALLDAEELPEDEELREVGV